MHQLSAMAVVVRRKLVMSSCIFCLPPILSEVALDSKCARMTWSTHGERRSIIWSYVRLTDYVMERKEKHDHCVCVRNWYLVWIFLVNFFYAS